MQPSPRVAQRSLRRQSRPAEADHTAEPTPAATASPASAQGEHRLVHRRAAHVAPAAQETSTQAGQRASEAHRPPRTSLCSRTTQYLLLALGLGFLGMRMQFRSAAPERSPLDAAHPPASPLGEDATQLHPKIGPAPGPDAPSSSWVEAPEVDELEAGEHALNPLVEGFRRSSGFRDVHQLSAFMETMTGAIARAPRQSASQLEQLLHVWRWRFGETFRAEDGQDVNVGALMAHAIVRPVATQLGGPHIPDAHLRLLVATICREPDHIPPGEGSTNRLTDHAEWVARALRQVVVHTAVDRTRATVPERQASEEAQLRRCLRMGLEATSHDPRWMPLIAAALPEIGPNPESDLLMTKARWVYAVFDEFSQHVTRSHKGPVIPHYVLQTLKALVQKVALSRDTDLPPSVRDRTAMLREKFTTERRDGSLQPVLSPADIARNVASCRESEELRQDGRTRDFMSAMASALDGPRISKSNFLHLVQAVCEEPAVAQSEKLAEKILLDKGQWVGVALVRIFQSITPEPGQLSAAERQKVQAAHFRRCAEIVLASPVRNRFWPSAIVNGIRRQVASSSPHTLISEAEWKEIVFDALAAHRARTAPAETPPASQHDAASTIRRAPATGATETRGRSSRARSSLGS